MAKKGYSDAGARVKELQNVDVSKSNVNYSQRGIDANNEYEKDFKVIEDYMSKASPEVKAMIHKHKSHYMMPELFNGMSAKDAVDKSPEGRDHYKDMKIRSMDDLKKAKKLLDQSDDDGDE